MSNVYTKGCQISTWYVKSQQQWTYTEQNVACLMLAHISSQTILRAVCLISLSLTHYKWQETLEYQIKNETADLIRIIINLIGNSIFTRVWKLGT